MYQILRGILSPFLELLKFFDTKKGIFLKKRLAQNFSKLQFTKYIWIHCSSVGEINLTETLIKKILDKREERILLTLFTDTGFDVANTKFGTDPRVDIFYFPLDDKKNIRSILSKMQLKLLILVETEIWPILLQETKKSGAKIIMINGRISDKSLKKYLYISNYLKKIFKNIDNFYMQSEEDSNRIVKIGASREKVETLGNLKFDITFENFNQDTKQKFKAFLDIGEKKVFTAGSIRTGEYDLILDVFEKLKNTVLILVPRHIERVPQVEEILKKRGILYKNFTELEKNLKLNVEKLEKCGKINSTEKEINVIIVDKIGELRKIYSITDIAFVGGTLVNIGGHSLLEPLFYGKTPIFGTYTQNIRTISKEILQLNLGYKIKNVDEFLQAIKSININQNSSKEKINELFEKNNNVTDKILDKIENLI